MIDGTHPRDWSPNWGLGVCFLSIAVSAAAFKLIEHGMWPAGCALEIAMLVGCAFTLGRLAPSGRRKWGALAVPLGVALLASDTLKPRETSGWWAHFLLLAGVMLAFKILLDMWLARRDRRRHVS